MNPSRSELHDLQEHQQPKPGNGGHNAAGPQRRFRHSVHIRQQALHHVGRHGVDQPLDQQDQRKADEQKAAPEQELSHCCLPNPNGPTRGRARPPDHRNT